MPIPSPNPGESKENFIRRVVPEIYNKSSRIKKNKTPKEKSKQAVAMAMSSWRKENHIDNKLEKLYLEWAEDRRIDSLDDGNTLEYNYLTNLIFEKCLCGIGKHNKIPDSEFDKEQLETGVDIEKEHTDNKEIAKEIAKDHISEIPDYYTRLKKMEKESNK